MFDAVVSYRACPKILTTLQRVCPSLCQAPVANTVQNWVLRIGLHELTRPKEQADDWVLLIDHTIQLGNQKCLVIVGIRLSHCKALARPIRLSDLSMILIEVVDTSNGTVVAEQLARARALVGGVVGVVSDQGSDLTGGIALLEQNPLPEKPNAIGLTDMSHRAATALKHVLEKDPNWKSFLAHCGTTQPKAKQTELGSLLPPKLKVKARYMNLQTLLGWSERMLALLDQPAEQRPNAQRLGRLDEKFGWLLEYRQSIACWSRLMSMVNTTLDHARREGFAAGGAERLAGRLANEAIDDQTKRFRDEVVEAMRSNIAKLPPGVSLPASSEILESLIGKGKQLGGQHCREGFTRNVLSMAATVASRDEATIRESFRNVTTKKLSTWVDKQLGTTLTAFRRQVLPRSTGSDPA